MSTAKHGLAEALWQARRTGGVIARDAFPAPATGEEAYAVQAEVARLSGLEMRGFKVGSTSLEAQRALGTTEPGSAPLLAPFVLASPARMRIERAHAPAVEGELAFRLGADLAPREQPYTRDEVAGAIEAVAGAIEVVGTRFTGGLAGIGRYLSSADGGLNIAFVSGPWTTSWRQLDLVAHQVTMRINGQVCGEGTGARALGDPMNVMIWLANQQSRMGRGLKRGDIVSTGTCTGLDAVAPRDRVAADFGTLGTVEIAFE